MLFMLPKGYERQTINWCGNEPKLPRIQAQPQQLPGFAEKSKEPNSLAGKESFAAPVVSTELNIYSNTR